MTQVTSGIRRVLSIPSVYDALQNILGAKRSRRRICVDHVRAVSGDVVVDVGCGTAVILEHLPSSIVYHGFDLSAAYIDSARQRYGDRGNFHCRDITQLEPGEIPPCQIVLAIGLLHHLDDGHARTLLAGLHSHLAPNGRVITVDPAYWPRQSNAGRFLIARDRGQNVRTGEGYRQLVPEAYSRVLLKRRDDLLNIPYSHAVMECIR